MSDSDLVWLHSPNGIHNNYGLEIMSLDPVKVESFWHNVEMLSNRFGLQAFRQGYSVRQTPGIPSWCFMEFRVSDFDKILNALESFNKLYGHLYHGGEIEMTQPTRELLESLKLM